MNTIPWSKDRWFSPKFAIEELSRAAARGETPEKYKRYQEAWVCGVALTCFSDANNEDWWIQIPEKDPPDVLAMRVIPHIEGKGQTMLQAKLEVFEISAHDKETVFESIVRKIGVHDYLGMTLIAFLRRPSIFDNQKLADDLIKLNPKADKIIVLASELDTFGNKPGPTEFSVIEVFPAYQKIRFDFAKIWKNRTQFDFTDATRSTKMPVQPVSTTIDRVIFVP